MSTWREEVSEDTKVMIDQLSQMKAEINKTSELQATLLRIVIILSISLGMYAFWFLGKQSEEDLFQLLASFISPMHIFLILLLAVLYLGLSLSRSNLRVKQQHLENLRLEVIDHLKNTWFKNERSSIRDNISRDMEALDINVRYKSSS